MRTQQNALGSFLRTCRNTNQLSLREVERQTGISNAYLSQLESGKIRNPSPTILHTLACLYGVSYRELMQLAGYPVPGMIEPSTLNFISRIGSLTEEEEEELIRHLAFLRARRMQKEIRD